MICVLGAIKHREFMFTCFIQLSLYFCKQIRRLKFQPKNSAVINDFNEQISFLGSDLVKRQALLCHRVLRAIEGVAKESAILTRDTWETLLKFLLAANDSLLSPPTEKGLYNRIMTIGLFYLALWTGLFPILRVLGLLYFY